VKLVTHADDLDHGVGPVVRDRRSPGAGRSRSGYTPVVAVRDGAACVLVRCETEDDLLTHDTG